VAGRPYLPGLTVVVEEDGEGEANVAHFSSVRRAAAAVLLLGGKIIDPAEAARRHLDEDVDALEALSKDWKVETVGGGVTNRLYRVHIIHYGGIREENTNKDSTASFSSPLRLSSCLVRVFGGEGLIDRDAETLTFASLADQGLAPPYYGRLENARVEGWCDGMRPLSVEELGLAPIRRGIAEQMARLHADFSLSDELALVHDPSRPVLWTQLDDWLMVALRNEKNSNNDNTSSGTETGSTSSLSLPSTEAIRAELDWVRGWMMNVAAMAETEEEMALADAVGGPKDDESLLLLLGPRREVTFCHNDVLAANVLWDDTNQKIQLIDFEYGGYNYAAFDVANHFNERAGGPPTSSVPDYGMFPTPVEQKEFLTDYLRARDRSTRGGESASETDRAQEDGTAAAAAVDPSPRRLNSLWEEVRFFVLVNHLYWGLWALNQSSSEGNQTYDYETYAYHRFRQYFHCKNEVVGAPTALTVEASIK
jgi:ethanolamine kinase